MPTNHWLATQRALPLAPQLPREAFYESRALSSVRLSPDGRQVAYLRKQGEQRSAWVQTLDTGTKRNVLARTSADQILWSTDSARVFLRAANAVDSIGINGKAGAHVRLGGTTRRQFMAVDQSQPAAILIRERVLNAGPTAWRVLRVTADGRETVVLNAPYWIQQVVFDTQGLLTAFAFFDEGRDGLMRFGADRKQRVVMRMRPLERVGILGASADGSLWLETNVNADLRRVERMDAQDKRTVLHQDPSNTADLDETVVNPLTGEPVAASYRSATAATYGIGAQQSVVSAITTHFNGNDVGLQTGGGRWLVSERGATLRDARWYVYDHQTFKRILEQTEASDVAIPESALAAKLPWTFTASDGLRVHGFLLVPPGVDVARAPLVVQVHGGPINHFRPGFDGVAQFLVNRGYVVYQSNFRGSTGFGRDYTFASNGDYGNGRVQQDIVEGTRALLAQGIGDAARVGIVGHSFGGYSTLVGLTFQPDLFKVGFAGAPPADLGWTMRWELGHGYQADLPDRSLKETLRALLLDGEDPAVFDRLHAQSPLNNAQRLRRPLLIFAGGADPTVPLRSITHYVASLRMKNRPVTLVVDPDSRHSPEAGLAMEGYLWTMETQLHAVLGGRDIEPAGARLKTWLKTRIRNPALKFDLR
jgi:dipeptidyl aminopeptidase/acylaminoacyl peptidase